MSATLTRARRRFPSSALVAGGLVVGFAVAQGTGLRWLGGLLLIGTGLAAAPMWVRRRGWPVAFALGALYLAAFVVSHVLSLGLGWPAWLSVASVTLVAAGATFALADRPEPAVVAR